MESQTIGTTKVSAKPAANKIDENVAESMIFKTIQERLVDQFKTSFPDRLAPKTVVIIPSLTMDEEILSKVSGITHYEERLLCLLLLLRMPRTQVIYVTSMPIDPVIVDYYLHLLPGITRYHAEQRLTLLSCYDASSKPLTQKILERPRLMDRIKKTIRYQKDTHLAFFNVTTLERTLAVKLDLPIFGCDPDLFEVGNKSNGRKVFKECGLSLPDGFEDLYSEKDIAEALYQLKQRNPGIKKAVVKLNDGFSGDGNGIFYYENTDSVEIILNSLAQRLKLVAEDLNYSMFIQKFREMGGVVEAFIEGDIKTSPSVQCRISPTGNCLVASTHDQELGGDTGQIFLGAYFPANSEYAGALGKIGKIISENLRDKGVLGRFAVDFISVKEGDEWKHYAIEINLRKGGTTHPYIMLEFLTEGVYDADKGEYRTATGQPRYYFSSDNLRSEKYIGTTPHDLIEIAMINSLHYDGALQEGVMFHLIGALSQYGKLGVVCVGSSMEKVKMYYKRTVDILDLESRFDMTDRQRV
jgi:hypothetical protein